MKMEEDSLCLLNFAFCMEVDQMLHAAATERTRALPFTRDNASGY